MSAPTDPTVGSRGGVYRIPLSLQAVFLASNRGKEVQKPPLEKVAHKTFFRGWMFRGFGKKRRKMKTQIVDGKKEVTQQQPPAVQTESLISPGSDASTELVCKGATIGREAHKEKNFNEQLPSRPPMSPQAFLDVLINARGYSTRRYRTLQTGYHSNPTAFQQASYNLYLVKMIRGKNIDKLRSVIQAGISPNPCNAYGESLVHMVCRRGDHEFLRMLLECGTSIQVSDDYGRTPLHDACWAAQPSFETVGMIAAEDMTLFHMTDSRGAVPLSYVRREHWSLWIEFLESKKDEWWPTRAVEDTPAPLTEIGPNQRPLPDPENALSIQLASMVASGVMSPEEIFGDDSDGSSSDSDQDEDSDDSDSDSEDTSDYDSDDDDDDDDDNLGGFSAEEMAGMLSIAKKARQHRQ